MYELIFNSLTDRHYDTVALLAIDCIIEKNYELIVWTVSSFTYDQYQ